MKSTTILAIETSCDETGVAIVHKEGEKVSILAETVASQVDIHAVTGGVVPEVAAREHVQVLRPLVEKVLSEASLKEEDITAIGITVGPGLMPALATGVMAAKTLAYVWKKPIVPAHHIEGHIYSALLLEGEITKKSFPVLAVIVSGGHTILVHMKNHLSYEIIGSTQDDAAGEAFDKVARLLELPYPGGPQVSALAEKGNPTAFEFPRPMIKSDNLNFSFSGLKTAVLYTWRALSAEEKEQKKADIAASFQQAVVDVITEKTRKAIQKYQPNTVLLAGGVAANKRLRTSLQNMVEGHSLPFQIAPSSLCGDNASMIGQVATYAFESGRKKSWADVEAIARIPITEFSIR